MPSFDEIRDDFLRISSEVVWATVATVDTRGRPRTRVLHPIWEVEGERPVGWIGTGRTPLDRWATTRPRFRRRRTAQSRAVPPFCAAIPGE